MRDLAVVFIHFIAVLARLLGPGGVRSLVAEPLLLKRQILILNRSRKRFPHLHASNRIHLLQLRSAIVMLYHFVQHSDSRGRPHKVLGFLRKSLIVGTEAGDFAFLPEKFQTKLNLTCGCRSSGDGAGGSGEARCVGSGRRREDNQVWRVEIGSVQ